jgi:chromosome segregation ATPase
MLESRLGKQTATIQDLEAKLSDVPETVDTTEMEEKISALGTELIQMKEYAAECESKLSATLELNATLSDQIQSLEETVAGLKLELIKSQQNASVNQELEELKERLVSLTQQTVNYQSEVFELKDKLSEQQDELDGLRNAPENDISEELEDQLTEAQSKIKQFEEKVPALLAKLNESTQKLANYEKTNSDLLNKVGQLSQKLAKQDASKRLTTDVLKEEQKIGNLEKDLKVSLDKIADLTFQKSQSMDRLADLADENETLRRQLSEKMAS